MRRASLLLALLVLVVVILSITWVAAAVATGDGLWFVPVFSQDAMSIELYWDGGHVLLERGAPGYEQLNAALRQDLARVRAFPGQVGLSDSTLEQLYADGRLVVVYYAQPARIHSRYYFAASTVYYIPLSGHHAAQSRVFNAGRGALELRSTAEIMAAAEAVAQQQGLGQP